MNFDPRIQILSPRLRRPRHRTGNRRVAAARRAICELLFSGRLSQASVSELARRAGLTPRAVAVEVEKLSEAGLVEVEAIGSAHVVRANEAHPAAAPLRALLTAATTAAKTEPADRKVRRSLAACGAPLQGEGPEAFWKAVERARARLPDPVPVQPVGLYAAPYDDEDRRRPLEIAGERVAKDVERWLEKGPEGAGGGV